ncbi:MAG: phosphoglucosamine mutase [Gammaproteobacteria bacterium]|jgi:phosphoglucosamine mutase|nr:phosphoglucosamine mutase [Gammaproteobacteria bacterium]
MDNNKQFFGTDGIRGPVGGDVINPELAMKLGWALGQVLLKQSAYQHVLIGKDTRISGYMLESALEAGLSAAGMDIHLLGPMPTPAIAYLTHTFRACAGIVISASHNGYSDNGMKFFSHLGTKLPDELEHAIEAMLQKPMKTVASNKLGKAKRIEDAPGRYIEFCKGTIPGRIALRGLTMVVDCANGATYHIAPNVFRELGATVYPVHISPNGLNINQHCGSTSPESLRETVLAKKANLGIAFDGDGDRVIMVDHKGEIVDGDELVFIMADYAYQQQRLVGGVVGTQMSNYGLEQAMANYGIPFVRTKVGDRYILAELEQRQWQLGGESSGHIIPRNLTTTGDGIIAALQVLAAMAATDKTLYELKKGMQKFPQAMINITYPAGKKISLDHHTEIQEAKQAVEKALSGKGRVLLRMSGTEPVVRVMVEGEDNTLVIELAKQLAAVVESSIVAE